MQSFEALRPFCYKNSKGYCFIDCLDSAITDHTANTDLLPNYSESIIELNSFQDSGIRLWIIGSWAKTRQNRFTEQHKQHGAHLKSPQSVSPCIPPAHLIPGQAGWAGEEPLVWLAGGAWLACLGLAPGPHSGHRGVVTLLHSLTPMSALHWADKGDCELVPGPNFSW